MEWVLILAVTAVILCGLVAGAVYAGVRLARRDRHRPVR